MSTTFKFIPNTLIFKNPTIIQHFTTLSIILAIKNCYINDSMECEYKSLVYKNLPIMIKWPNDVYYKNESKIGGILVNSYFKGGNLNSILSIYVKIFVFIIRFWC